MNRLSKCTLLKKLVNHHDALEREAGRHGVYTPAYEQAMAKLGSFTSEVSDLKRIVAWLEVYYQNGCLQKPDPKDESLKEQATLFDQIVVEGVIKGKTVDEILETLYGENEEEECG